VRKLILASMGLCAIVFGMPKAHADVPGVPNPPSYPCIGPFGLAAVVPYQYFDCPTEANGVHYHCEMGGATISGGAIGGTNGGSIGGLGTFGFVFGNCGWRWPDNTDGPAPNPPGAWRNFLVPSPIPVQHTAPPRPYDQTIDVAPPPIQPPPPDPDAPPDAPAPLAAPQPQVLPPPIVAQPTIQPPVVPGAPEVLPPAPEKLGAPVDPGQGVVPPPNLSPKDLNPTAPDRDSLRPRGN
jgi:hypothetical protein